MEAHLDTFAAAKWLGLKENKRAPPPSDVLEKWWGFFLL
jgi:hypothetical protein